MLDANSSQLLHSLQNASLIALSVFFLPLDTLIAFSAYAFNLFYPPRQVQHGRKQALHSQPKNVLVTGVGMTKGLTLARLFYEAGHHVIGADFSELACGRVSKSVARFYQLRRPDSKLGSAPYIESLLTIVSKENIDLWVSCSGVASAVEDGEAKEIIEKRTSCKAIQFDIATTQLLHEKHSFIEHTRSLGLTVPETHTISDREAATTVLRNAGDRRYIVKPIGVDDARRGDMTLLPKSNMKETEEHLYQLDISEESPWILQQFINGPEYCTHALVIHGVVKAFVACPSAELLMHYEALSPNSKPSRDMLEFTCKYAAKQSSEFTGHLSFDFMLEESEQCLYPIECNPRAHTAVVLFNGTPGLAEAYLSVLEPTTTDHVKAATEDGKRPIATPITPLQKDKYFWIGHDLVTRLLLPLLQLLTLQKHAALSALFQSTTDMLEHVLFWRDGTFERWDPLPWWWLYHVYWPMQFWKALKSGSKWSRANVSTTKMFQC